MKRTATMAVLLLSGCTERLMHMEYGVALRDACPPGDITAGNMCISGGFSMFTEIVVGAVLTIWIVLTLRRLDASSERIEKLAQKIDAKIADD